MRWNNKAQMKLLFWLIFPKHHIFFINVRLVLAQTMHVWIFKNNGKIFSRNRFDQQVDIILEQIPLR